MFSAKNATKLPKFSRLQPVLDYNFVSSKMKITATITQFISSFFQLKAKNLLVSPLQVASSSSKITISFYYYQSTVVRRSFLTNQNTTDQNSVLKYDLSRCATILSKLLEKEVEIRCTRLFYPYMNSTILAHYLAKNAASNTFLHFKKSILSYPSFHASSLPSSILGIKIQLSGRITTQAVVPRLTVKSSSVGSFSKGYIDHGFCTTKNKLGAFTIKV